MGQHDIGRSRVEAVRIAEEEREVRSVGRRGALTSRAVLPFWQVPLSLLESVARRYAKGNGKGYPIHNWRIGLDDPAFLRDRANHAAVHFMRLLNGHNEVDDAQGNLDAVGWWCAMANEALRLYPEVWAATFYAESREERVDGG